MNNGNGSFSIMINSLKADTTISHVVGYTPALKFLIYKNMNKYIHPFIYKINLLISKSLMIHNNLVNYSRVIIFNSQPIWQCLKEKNCTHFSSDVEDIYVCPRIRDARFSHVSWAGEWVAQLVRDNFSDDLTF